MTTQSQLRIFSAVFAMKKDAAECVALLNEGFMLLQRHRVDLVAFATDGEIYMARRKTVRDSLDVVLHEPVRYDVEILTENGQLICSDQMDATATAG